VQEDYYVDKSGDRVPVRWLCPDCVTFDDAGTLVLKPVTKDDNIWCVYCALRLQHVIAVCKYL
jgi:hypothetical protein